MTHTARMMDWDTLVTGLEANIINGHIHRNVSGDLAQYTYTQSATYDKVWNPFTLMARGLILDHAHKTVLATPFEKFFNYGERPDDHIPDLPFEVMEKLDGSLIIVYWDGQEWRTNTKGSFFSPQAVWAKERLQHKDLSILNPGTTYLFEAIYPENRIVVHYAESALVSLGAYDIYGEELSYAELSDLADALGERTANRYHYDSISHLISQTNTLSVNEEGFVVKFSNGFRWKIKGEEYKRVHALISRITPLAMWECMSNGDDLELIRQQLPEEFWQDFDQIVNILDVRIKELVCGIETIANTLWDKSDKEVGLLLPTFPDTVRRFIFPYRKNNGVLLSGNIRKALFREIRPTGNVLLGYVPSYAMNRVTEDLS